MRLWTAWAAWALAATCAASALEARVEVEEPVYALVNPNNGSGPLWSFGCTPLARVGERVFVCQMETGEGVPLLCNTRWRLLERIDSGWRMVAEADGYRQREPVVVATDAASRLFLNVNDSMMPPGTRYGACDPHVLAFEIGGAAMTPKKLSPEWEGKPTFTDHSYRGYAADAANQRLLLFNIDARTSEQNYCVLAMDGTVVNCGKLSFPVRACYPQAAIAGEQGHILAVGDIVEPVAEWRAYKKEKTGREWDYVFRRLFYARAENVLTGRFDAPIEIANVDATAGHISNHDLWIGPNGDAYVLYSEAPVASELMREKFFPDKTTTPTLMLAIVRGGSAAERHVLVAPDATQQAGAARFHVRPNGEVWALVYLSGPTARNVLLPIYPSPGGPAVEVPFKSPFTNFLLASTRAGNAASDTIDVVGTNGGFDGISYGRIALEP